LQNESYRKRFASHILGTFTIERNPPARSLSEISIQPPIPSEITRLRRIIEKRHPLKPEEPRSWKNIPPVIQAEFIAMVGSIIEGDESLFDY